MGPFRGAGFHRCPRCKDIALNEAKSFGVHRFTCKRCFGAWLAWDEVLRQFEANELSNASRVFASVEAPNKLRCPHVRCNRVMKAVVVADNTVVDYCVEHGFWFDRGELSESLRAADLDPAMDDVDEPAPLSTKQALAKFAAEAPTPEYACDVCSDNTPLRCGMCAQYVCAKHLIADNCRECLLTQVDSISYRWNVAGGALLAVVPSILLFGLFSPLVGAVSFVTLGALSAAWLHKRDVTKQRQLLDERDRRQPTD